MAQKGAKQRNKKRRILKKDIEPISMARVPDCLMELRLGLERRMKDLAKAESAFMHEAWAAKKKYRLGRPEKKSEFKKEMERAEQFIAVLFFLQNADGYHDPAIDFDEKEEDE